MPQTMALLASMQLVNGIRKIAAMFLSVIVWQKTIRETQQILPITVVMAYWLVIAKM